MRIISGSARGVRLKPPAENLPVRPTTDRVKEAMFSIIQFDIKGTVLDLFAGTGQLGLEALSRGAQKCEHSCAIVRENITRAHMQDRAVLLHTDYKRYLKHTCTEQFDVVFIDPPYQTGLSDKALTYLSDGSLLNPGSIVVVECACEEKKPEKAGVLSLKRRYTYSGVSVLIYTKEGNELV